MKTALLTLGAFAALLAGCASWRWVGPTTDVDGVDDALPSISTATRSAVPRAAAPPTPAERFRTAQFYSDLGPDQVDVSAYPTQQRYNYGVYARACSRCHTLARSINAPMVGRGWWEFYMLGMRARSRFQGRPLSKEETRAVLDFLEYDSRARKVEHRGDFDRLTEELKGRFDASVSERMNSLQRNNARPLIPREP